MSKVLIFTGPPGAGKSTVGKMFTHSADGAWAYIDQDEIRMQIKAGFKNPSEPWDEQTQIQWGISIDICADMARRYQVAGINCLLDCFMPPHTYRKWQKAFRNIDNKVVVLLPPLEKTLKRNAIRNGMARLRDEQVHQHYQWFSGYIDDDRVEVIDSSSLSPQDTVQALSRVISDKEAS